MIFFPQYIGQRLRNSINMPYQRMSDSEKYKLINISGQFFQFPIVLSTFESHFE